MKKKRFSRTARLLLILGAAAQLAAMLALASDVNLIQYALCAPDVQKIESPANPDGTAAPPTYETGLSDMQAARDDLAEQLIDGVDALSLCGAKAGYTLSAGGNSASATLWAVDARYLEVCPRPMNGGRWMDGAEFSRGARVIVLDDDLAFKLFGSDEAMGASVRVGDVDYRVVGTAKHARGVGDVDEYGAYIPLNAADKQGLQLDTLTLNALPRGQSAIDQSFSSAAREKLGAGEFHNLRKDAMGALMLTRLIAFAFGMALAARLAKLLTRWARHCSEKMRERKARSYPRQYLPPAVARVASVVFGAAALFVAVYALLSFMIEPVYTFTEWVPESLVKISALKSVFWNRVSDAARMVRVNTPQAAEAAFWGGMAQFGAALFLLGLALGRRREKKMKDPAKAGNQSPMEAV